MPRKKRYTQFYMCHHVMLRGNAGQIIFLDDKDRTRFSLILQKAAEEYQFSIHAFCFMSNHVHLILEPTTHSLSVGVQSFAGRYAQYFNRRHKKRGHLFQDRFRSILIEDDEYLMRLVRYIHLNPIRANLVELPQNYYWSSYCVYLGLRQINWLTQSRVLKKFCISTIEARQALIIYTSRMVDAELDVKVVRESNQIGAFGSESFIEEIIDVKIPTTNTEIQLLDLVAEAQKELRFNVNEITSDSREKRLVDIRSILALCVQNAPGLYLQQLAQYLNRDSSSLCRLIKRAQKSQDLSERAKKLLGLVRKN